MSAPASGPEYLLAGRSTEVDRLRVQGLAWEDAGRSLARQIPPVEGARAIDVACGPLGWLRVLSEWAGRGGEVVGTDVEEKLLAAGRSFVDDEGLTNVSVVVDDLFDSRLAPHSFDVVHARFTLAPLGRLREQLHSFTQLVRPGGWIVLEESDAASWRLNPTAPGFDRLIELIVRVFKANGGDIDIGRRLPSLLRSIGVKPQIAAHVQALPAADPHVRMPLQFLSSLEPKLLELVSENELQTLRRSVENELADPNRWGTTFTLIQSWGQSAG
jgi:ubiquinone/menaquinone biosynthesis C-methylase UbiE